MTSDPERVTLCHDIIARVRNHPEMWTSTHPLYRNRMMHKNFWKKFSKELGVDEHLIRRRWKGLKDQYRKEVKRCIEKNLPEELMKWQYYESLSFLKDEVLRDKPETSSAPAVQSEEESDDDEQEEDVAAKVRIVEAKTDMIYNGLMETKAAIEERMKAPEERPHHDPDYMYLMSLLPTLKQLTEIQKLQLKGKINDWLLEAYLGQCDTKFIVSDQMN